MFSSFASNALLSVKGTARNVIRGSGPLRKVTVQVIQAQNLICMDEKGRADPFFELTLGGYQTRQTSTCFRTLDPVFRETFEFGVRGTGGKDTILRVAAYNTDVLGLHDEMGYVEIDVGKLPLSDEIYKWYDFTNAPTPNKKGVKKNKAKGGDVTADGHPVSFGEGPGKVLLSIVVTEMFEKEYSQNEVQEMKKNYCGWLKVHIIEAKNLKVAEGSCDPYCTIRVGKRTFKTDAKKANSAPQWDTLVQLPVKDIFDIVEINIMNDDRRGSTDFIGGLMVPLLDVPKKNKEIQWYQLKDETHKLFLGDDISIRVAFELTYSIPQGAISLLQKREARHVDEPPPFSFRKTRVLGDRIKEIAIVGVEAMQLVDKALNFEYGVQFNVGFLIGWIIFWALVEIYMIPMFIGVAILLRARKNSSEGEESKPTDANQANPQPPPEADPADADEEISLLNPESIKRAMNKAYRMRGMLQLGQNFLEDSFDNIERINNLTNWTFPILTGSVVAVLFSTTFFLMFFPIRLVPIFGGIGIFARAAFFHYLPELQKAPKGSIQRKIVDIVHHMPSPVQVGINVFYKLPSDDDLERNANQAKEDETEKFSQKILDLNKSEQPQPVAKPVDTPTEPAKPAAVPSPVKEAPVVAPPKEEPVVVVPPPTEVVPEVNVEEPIVEQPPPPAEEPRIEEETIPAPASEEVVSPNEAVAEVTE